MAGGKRNSFDDRGGGRNNKRRKSNDGRGIDRNSNSNSNSNNNSNNDSNDNGCSVFVGNLKYETKWQALEDHMRRAGNIDSVKILEAQNGRSKGCALVKYQHPKEVQRAIQELNESELEGRTIFVQPDRDDQDRDRGRGDSSNNNNNNNDRNSNDRGRNNNNNNNNDFSSSQSQYGVYVGNLPYECSWQALKDFFKSCGSIERAQVMEDSNTGRKKGFGVVTFSTERAMDNAIRKFHGRDFQGRMLEVRQDKKSASASSASQPFGGRNTNEGDNNNNNGNKDGFKIYVGNLDYECSWKDLKDLVQRVCGRGVEHADIPKRGFGIVTFATHRDGAEAISRLGGSVFQNRPLEVRWDRDRDRDRDNNRDNNGNGNGRDEGRRNPSSSSSSSSSSLKQLYVGNLSYDCTWQNLKDVFKRFGAVVHAEVCETANGKTTGFGIVAFSNPTSTERAMTSMNGADFQGRKLTVRWDRSPEKLEAEKSSNNQQGGNSNTTTRGGNSGNSGSNTKREHRDRGRDRKREHKPRTATKTTTTNEQEEDRGNALDMALSCAR